MFCHFVYFEPFTYIFSWISNKQTLWNKCTKLIVFKKVLNAQCVSATNKRTDACWDIFMIWKINSGLVWAAGPVLEKKVWGRLWATFEGVFFMFSWAKKRKFFFWKNCSVRTEKLHRKKVKNFFFLGGENFFFYVLLFFL